MLPGDGGSFARQVEDHQRRDFLYESFVEQFLGNTGADSFCGTDSDERRADLAEVFEAFSAGYNKGLRTQPLFGLDWNDLWNVPIEEVRARLAIDQAGIVGEGIRAAAY